MATPGCLAASEMDIDGRAMEEAVVMAVLLDDDHLRWRRVRGVTRVAGVHWVVGGGDGVAVHHVHLRAVVAEEPGRGGEQSKQVKIRRLINSCCEKLSCSVRCFRSLLRNLFTQFLQFGFENIKDNRAGREHDTT